MLIKLTSLTMSSTVHWEVKRKLAPTVILCLAHVLFMLMSNAKIYRKNTLSRNIFSASNKKKTFAFNFFSSFVNYFNQILPVAMFASKISSSKKGNNCKHYAKGQAQDHELICLR